LRPVLAFEAAVFAFLSSQPPSAVEMLLYSCFHDHAVEHVNVVVFSVAWILRGSFSPVLCLQPKVEKIGVFAAIYIPICGFKRFKLVRLYFPKT
jgi:hypothetical protein